jgi:steroid 5-alpha reductase family enzyme
LAGDGKATMLHTFFIALVMVLLFMGFAFMGALVKKRNDIADVVWGHGFILIAILALYKSDCSPRALLVFTLVTIWATRLSWYIVKRHIGKPEDSRYAKWREEWGGWFLLRSFLQVFMLQGILLTVIALPIIVVGTAPATSLGILDAAGATVWIAGFIIEATADRQLANFISDSNNRGRIIMTGLWNWSRHPNYFGEVVLWWGIWIISLAASDTWITLLGPLTISLLILTVSGIPMIEERYRNNPAYQAYAERTSVFLPLPPRKER